MQHRNQLTLVYVQFHRQQGLQLCVPVLFYDKDSFMGVDKFLNAVGEGKRPDAHIIQRLISVFENFLHGSVAAAQCDDGGFGARLGLRQWFGHKFFRGFPFSPQAVEHLLVLLWILGIASVLVVAGTPGEETAARMNPGKRTEANTVAVGVLVPVKIFKVFQFLLVQNLAAVGFVGRGPGKFRAGPVIHADVQIGQHDHRSLQAFRQVECLKRKIKTFLRVGGEQEYVAGIAVGCESATQDVGLLRAGGHSGGGADPLDVEDHGGHFRVVPEAEKFRHQGDAWPAGAGKCPGSVPAGADGHPDCGEFIFRLDDTILFLPGDGIYPELLTKLGEPVHEGGRRGDGVLRA